MVLRMMADKTREEARSYSATDEHEETFRCGIARGYDNVADQIEMFLDARQ